MDGGSGADTFVFEPGNRNDYIMDFTPGEDMSILKGFTDENGNALTSVSGDSTQGDGNYVIDLSDYGGGMITILSVGDNASISGDFMFT